MTETIAFQGKALCNSRSELGEGPTYDPHTDTFYWFNILGKELHELSLSSGRKTVHALPFKASVLARIDGDRQLVASERGLMIRDVRTGAFSLHVELEPAHMGNRSNDGRVHPSGALWIGTMGLKAQDGAGSIYHVAQGTVTRLFTGISIPNAICFSADGTAGYFTDTRVNRIMRVALDPATGLPISEAKVFADTSGRPGGSDGAVCDNEGNVWNARWGQACIERFSPDGQLVARYALPTSRVSCPAFAGANADRLFATTAFEGATAEERQSDTLAGTTFDLGISVSGRHELAYRP